MSHTLFQAMLDTARIITKVYEGTPTSSGSGGFYDTNQLSTIDDYYNGGVLFLTLSDASKLSTPAVDYTNSSRYWTHAALGAGLTVTRYAASIPEYNRGLLMRAVNDALSELGPVTQVDATLTVVANTEEYSLPAGVQDVVQVEVASNASTPYTYKGLRYWRENAGTLYFTPGKEPTDTSKKIRLWYNAPHAELSTDAGVVSSAIAPARLSWNAAVLAVQARIRLVNNAESHLATWLKEIGMPMKERMDRAFPVRNLVRPPVPSGWLA